MLNDPFVRKAAQTITLFIAAMFAAVSLLGALVAIDYLAWPENTGSPALVAIIKMLPSSEGSQAKEILGLLEIFVAALPAILIGVAVKKEGNDARRLNRVGQAIAVLFFISVLFAAFAYLAISPEKWGSDHRLELEGLKRLLTLIRGSLQASVFYLGLLLGMRAVK